MTEMRKDRRAPASLKVKYKSASVDEFIEQFGADVSRGGIFIKTKKPLETGALLKFEFQLQGGAAVIHGVGRVAWRRAEEHARPDLPAGMGIKFIKLDEQSRAVIERIEARHGAGSRFDQTEAAELAPPISSVPPGTPLSPPPAAPRSVAPGARPTPLVPGPLSGGAAPANQVEPAPIGLSPAAAAALAAARLPRAVSGSPGTRGSLPGQPPTRSAATASPTFRPPPAALSSIPPALSDPAWPGSAAAPRPAGDKPKSIPVPAPKGALGGSAPARRPAPSNRSAARDTSEFLASAFSAGGAGQEVRSQARAQVERARHDPHSVDLANELFGDLSEPAKKSPPPEAAAEASFGDVLSELDPAPPKPTNPEDRAVTEKIPSIEELVNEAAHANPALAASSAARDEAAAREAEADALRSVNPPGMAANDQLPLTLDLPSLSAPSADAKGGGSGASKALWLVLVALVFVGVASGVFYMLRGRQAPPPEQAPAAPTPPAAAAPSPPAQPAAAPAAEPQPAAAAPAAPAAVSIALRSEPAGADVLVDGKAQGQTPTSLSLAVGSEVELSLKLAGHATKTEKLKVEPGMTEHALKLEPLAYELTIVSEPKGARVSAGSVSGEAGKPLALGHLEGPVEVTLEKPGFQKATRTVQLAEFKEDGASMRAELTQNLSPVPALPAKKAAPPPAAAVRALKPPEPEAPPAPEAPVVQIKPEEPAPKPEAAAPTAPADPPAPAP
jgi:uncharacterized protein (TIGR02266 family)